jgi:anti-sigma factor RsiW
MKPESLHALIIDRHLGELSPEAAELLEHHLAGHAAARTEAERILQSLNITRDAVLRHPELARVAASERQAAVAPQHARIMPWLARAAAVLLLAALTGAGGFLAGRSETQALAKGSPSAAAEAQATPRKESPWARYRMTFDPSGDGMQVVRVDTPNLEGESIQ